MNLRLAHYEEISVNGLSASSFFLSVFEIQQHIIVYECDYLHT